MHGGSEYWVQPAFALRVGMNDQRPSGGFSYRTSGHYQFDYGVSDHPLGIVHRIGVSYRFGGFYGQRQGGARGLLADGRERRHEYFCSDRAHKSETDNWSLSLINKTDEVVRPLRRERLATGASPLGRQERERHAASRTAPIAISSSCTTRTARKS